MVPPQFQSRRESIQEAHTYLLATPNQVAAEWRNGVFERFRNPVVTQSHVPLDWRYDFNPETNPHFLERLGVNATFNSGAILRQGKVLLIVRIEGADRKSFFGVAESDTGIDGFRFWDEPVVMPETADPDTNIYDMRVTAHEDGSIYGLFCTERKDPDHPHDLSAATAQCGICRTKDFKTWERLPDLVTPSAQQRNVVLHPEYVQGKYALYTRPQDKFLEAGSGQGIGWGLCDSMEKAVIDDESTFVDRRIYHTIKELKNGQGPSPIKTDEGWLHLAHGVRATATGMRYVLYLFMTSLEEPWRVTYAPGGYFLAPWEHEAVGDLWSVAFSNGWVALLDGRVLIYYATNDTQTFVAQSSLDRLVDYCKNTPEDPLRSAGSVAQRLELISKNKSYR